MSLPEITWKTLVGAVPRLTMVCRNCGSEDVTRDAVVRWSVEDQAWEVSGIFDNADCDHCGETKLEERSVS